MKKLPIFLLIISGLIYSCQIDKKDTNNNNVSSSKNLNTKETKVINDSPKNNLNKKIEWFKNDTLINDTLCKGNFIVTVESIEKDSFINAIFDNRSKIYEKLSSSKEKLNDKVVRTNEALIITLTSGEKDTILSTHPTRENLGFEDYIYIEYLSKINSHLLFGSYSDASGCILVNGTSGIIDRKSIANCLSINESNDRLITYAYDDWAFSTGGFRIYDIKSGELIKLCSLSEGTSKRTGFYLAINNVFWYDNNQIFCMFELYHPEKGFFRRSFVKLSIIKNYNS